MRGIICLHCGAERSPEDSYCGKCGEPLPVVCLECDAENPWILAKCKKCGANLLQKLETENTS